MGRRSLGIEATDTVLFAPAPTSAFDTFFRNRISKDSRDLDYQPLPPSRTERITKNSWGGIFPVDRAKLTFHVPNLWNNIYFVRNNIYFVFILYKPGFR